MAKCYEGIQSNSLHTLKLIMIHASPSVLCRATSSRWISRLNPVDFVPVALIPVRSGFFLHSAIQSIWLYPISKGTWSISRHKCELIVLMEVFFGVLHSTGFMLSPELGADIIYLAWFYGLSQGVILDCRLWSQRRWSGKQHWITNVGRGVDSIDPSCHACKLLEVFHHSITGWVTPLFKSCN